MNTELIKTMAIYTAFHNRDWCPGTTIDECIEDLSNIAEDANAWLIRTKTGIKATLNDYDVAMTLWELTIEDVLETRKELV